MLTKNLIIAASLPLLFIFVAGCRCEPYAVCTANAPKPLGPYSQAIACGGLVFGAGQLGIDPTTGKLVSRDADKQMEQALKNMLSVLEASGSSRKRLLKVTIYFKDLNDFDSVNVVYEKYLPDHRPARSAVQVSRIPDDAMIEIDFVAAR